MPGGATTEDCTKGRQNFYFNFFSQNNGWCSIYAFAKTRIDEFFRVE